MATPLAQHTAPTRKVSDAGVEVERLCSDHTYLVRPGGACLIVEAAACDVTEAHR